MKSRANDDKNKSNSFLLSVIESALILSLSLSLSLPSFCIKVGSEMDHKVKAAAAEGEEAWKGIGQEVGLKVWRIESFQVKPW